MRELREPRSKRLLPNRYKQQHINSPDFVCFCGLTDVVYPNETFNNCRYASVLCRLPTPPWPAAESKTELSPLLFSLSTVFPFRGYLLLFVLVSAPDLHLFLILLPFQVSFV